MTTLRACDGAVSSEQRRSNGSPAAAVRLRSAGGASVATADARSLRRDNDQTICLLLYLSWSGRRLWRRSRSVSKRFGFKRSKNEADARHDDQRVDGEPELSIREPPEDAQ